MNEDKIIRALGEIRDKLNPPTHYSFTVSEKSTNISRSLANPIKLNPNKKAEIAFRGLSTYYAFPNIISGVNNILAYSGDNGVTWRTDPLATDPTKKPMIFPI